ncbi:glycoside hydrolase family 88/105 protein [Kordiimonas sp.]|uniref:glycoside hydrolase family 88/105 protein n=1 Tax=Kordiimonas sp. TaxID=1970157 RepID=UPI003A932CE8
MKNWTKATFAVCAVISLGAQGIVQTAYAEGTLPQPEAVAQKVADRLVKDTTFAFKPTLPTARDEGYQYLDFHDSLSAVAGGVYVARADVTVNTNVPDHVLPLDALATASFGISHSAGAVTVLLDGEVIYDEATTEAHIPKGIDYDRYVAASYVKVSLEPGSKHKLSVKMRPEEGGEARVWLGFFSQSGASLGHRIALSPPRVKDAPDYMHFLIAGPLATESYPFSERSDLETGPLDFTRDYDGAEGKAVRWDLPRIHLQRKHSDKLEYADWRYFTGTILDSLYTVSDTIEKLDYRPFINQHMDFFIEKRELIARERQERGLLHSPFGHFFRYALLDDTGVTSLPFAERYIRTYGAGSGKGLDSEDYRLAKRAAEHIMNDIPRLDDGTIGRVNPVPLTIWADDMFMGAGILMRMARAEASPRYEAEAIKQILQIDQYLSDDTTGVYWHGYFGHSNEHSSSKWGRANGWTIMAKTDALLALDPSHPDYNQLLTAFRKHANGLLKLQSDEGRWHQVLDNPDTYLETSASSMFVRAFAEGIRNGWLDRDSFLDATLKGWRSVAAQVDDNGRVHGIVKGTPIFFNDQQYEDQPTRLNDPRGLGAFLYMTSSMHKLLKYIELVEANETTE